MASYDFRYQDGQSMPHKPIGANSDAEFYKKRDEWERETGYQHVAHTATCIIDGGIRKVPEPKQTEKGG